MAASTGDKITDTRNAARPNSAKVSSGRSAGGTTLACDNLVGWPTASKVHFVTYTIDSNSNPVAGTQLDCYGIVSGNNIGSFTVVDGTDTGNAVNDVVEMLPTAAYGQDLADALASQHNRTGAHKNITTDTITTTGNATVGGTLGAGASTVTTLHATGATTLDGAIGGAGYSTGTMSNPYKFSVYRNAAWTVSSSAYGVVPYDTKLFDTGTNVDVVTNKGRFTAPVAGFYQFNANAGIATTTDASNYAIKFYKNGVAEAGTSNISVGGVGGAGPATSCLIQLAANDYVEALLFAHGEAGATGKDNTAFSGFLVSAT